VVVVTDRSEARKKAREEKIKPTPPRTEALTKMQQMLDERKAERQKLDSELRIGQDSSISQQRLKLGANMVCFSSQLPS